MIGEAKDEIIRKVNEIKADVLIMGSRKMGAIKRCGLIIPIIKWQKVC